MIAKHDSVFTLESRVLLYFTDFSFEYFSE